MLWIGTGKTSNLVTGQTRSKALILYSFRTNFFLWWANRSHSSTSQISGWKQQNFQYRNLLRTLKGVERCWWFLFDANISLWCGKNDCTVGAQQKSLDLELFWRTVSKPFIFVSVLHVSVLHNVTQHRLAATLGQPGEDQAGVTQPEINSQMCLSDVAKLEKEVYL